MVVDTANGDATSAAGANAQRGNFTHSVDTPGKTTSTGRRLVRDLLEVVELQARIIGLKILSAIQASLLRLGLLFFALMACLAGIVFLYIAAFQTLEKVLPITTIFLIFGLVHLLIAVVLVVAAKQGVSAGTRTGKTTPGKTTTGKASEKPMQ